MSRRRHLKLRSLVLAGCVSVVVRLLCEATSLVAQGQTAIAFHAGPYPVKPRGAATLIATIAGATSGRAQFNFTFGDGSAATGWIDQPIVKHTYADPGHYETTVQVRDGSGLLGIRRATVTVVLPPSGRRPVHSSRLALSRDGETLWVVNPDNHTLTMFRGSRRMPEIPLGKGCNPEGVAISRTGEVWVACHGSDTLHIFDRFGHLKQSIGLPYGAAPFAVAPNPRENRIYVSLYGAGRLQEYDATSRKLRHELSLGPTPRAIAVSSSGDRLLVTRFISDETGGQLWDIAVRPNGLALTRTIELSGDITTPDTTISGRGLPNYLSGVTIAPDGLTALVTANKTNVFRGGFRDGSDLTTVNTIRSMVATVDLTAGTEILALRRDIDNSESPSAVTFSPLGDYAFVSLQGNNSLAIYDMLASSGTDIHTPVSRIQTGLAPQAALVNPSNSEVYSHDLMDRTVSVFQGADFFRGRSSTLPVKHRRSIKYENLPAEVLKGKKLFYNASDDGGPNGASRMSAEGYFSCASCHLAGGHDGRTWDFTGRGEGLRNTIDLRGRSGTGHGRVHWSSNFDEIQDFENDIRGAFGGTGFMSDADFSATSNPLGPTKSGLSPELDALAAYLHSLGNDTLPRSPYRKPSGEITDSALRGAELFAQLNCGQCHPTPKFTDSTLSSTTLHNVGTVSTSSGGRLGSTLSGIDTPTLLGLSASAPYLHDGSARSLSEVFGVAGADLYQAEEAMLGSDVSINNTPGAHFGRAIQFGSATTGAILSAISGGDAGGESTLLLRYAAIGDGGLVDVIVNGQTNSLELAANHSPGASSFVNWTTASIAVQLLPGAVNTVQVLPIDGATSIAIDEVQIITADQLARTAPHRVVATLPAIDRSDLLSLLVELDGREASGRFLRAYNFGGHSLIIDGERWLGTRSSSYQYNGRVQHISDVLPATSAALQEMLRSAIVTDHVVLSRVRSERVNVELYLQSSTSSSLEIRVNGVAASVPAWSNGWRMVGPIDVPVRNSQIAIDFAPRAAIAGIRLRRAR